MRWIKYRYGITKSSWNAMFIGAVIACHGFTLHADLREDFGNLKSAYEQDRARLVTPFDRIYLRGLQQLEALYVQERRYEEARLCRDERERVEARVNAPVGEEPEAFVFTASEAKTKGTVKETGGSLGAWSEGGAATWKLPGLALGGYEVFLEYSGTASPIEVQVQEVFYRLRGSLPYSNGSSKASLGLLRISDKKTSIELTLMTKTLSSNLQVKSLILVPQWP